MRNAKTQRANTMVCLCGLQQPPRKHVSHAEIGGCWTSQDYDGQRCALLTTKSRNTCTRATVFNSSG
jgi:hypothetical protein